MAIERPGTHPVAPKLDDQLQAAALRTDPSEALRGLLLEKEQLSKQLAQQKQITENSEQKISELQARVEQFADFEHIMKDSRSFLPVYLRDAILIKSLRIKLEKKYGKVANLDTTSESGRRLAHKYFDNVVEVCLQHCLNQWHLIDALLSEERPSANKV